MDKATAAIIMSSASLILPIGLFGVLIVAIRGRSAESAAVVLLTNVNRLVALLWKVILPVLVGFAIFGLGFWAFGSSGAELGPARTGQSVQSNDVGYFRDTLSIVLGVAGVFIAVVGVLAFLALRGMLVDHMETRVNERIWRRIVAARALLGYVLGRQYDETKQEFLLNLSIEVHQHMAQHLRELDESVHESEETICIFRNNWGYALTLLSQPSDSDRALAISIAEYLEERVARFPDHTEWPETISEIRKKFGRRLDTSS